jgi:hypothetical protein
MKSEQKEDFYERHGFKYNENTFDDLFVKTFSQSMNVSTESSEDEDKNDDIMKN